LAQAATLAHVQTLEFYFDYTCPYAYLASTTLVRLQECVPVPITLRPMFLGGVFRAVGTPLSLFATLSAQKTEHSGKDMMRWAALFGAKLSMPSNHPMRSAKALRATLASGCDLRVMHGFYDAYWVRNEDIDAQDTLVRVLRDAGHNAEEVLARADSESVKNELRARTDRAIGLGVFGAPAYVVDGNDLYWGQDRQHFVANMRYEDFYAKSAHKHEDRHEDRRAAMGRTLEIYWDFSSPFGYLGATQAKNVAERTGATLIWRPMFLGGLFKTIGQADFPMATFSQAKQKHYMDDMTRWSAYWGVPFKFPSRFPINTVKAMRAYLVLPEERRDAFRERTFAAFWGHDKDISVDAILTELIGPDGAEVLAKTQDAAIKQQLVDCTNAAAQAGVFGAPTWVVDGKELFWGQDRIPLVERALMEGTKP
jgi:2-hydroxychromene-2-carboxylate isomerase